MAKVRDVKNQAGAIIGQEIFCPACKCAHPFDSRWEFNGDYEKPTFKPSMHVSSGHYVSGIKHDHCWCTYNAEQIAKGEKIAPFSCGICHSFVTNGQIIFLSDCTHAMAGQIVGLEDFKG